MSPSLNVPIDLDRLELRAGRVAEPEVGLAAGLEQLLVRFGDDEPRAGHALQFRHAGDVVEVAVRRGQDLRVRQLEPELLDARLDLLAPCRRRRC